jgi:hypothetical protein
MQSATPAMTTTMASMPSASFQPSFGKLSGLLKGFLALQPPSDRPKTWMQTNMNPASLCAAQFSASR